MGITTLISRLIAVRPSDPHGFRPAAYNSQVACLRRLSAFEPPRGDREDDFGSMYEIAYYYGLVLHECVVAKSKKRTKRSAKYSGDELLIQAAKQEELGNLRLAFQLYLAAAKAGDTGGQLNVGNFYDAGTGVRRNRVAALYWYKRAYRRGLSIAASNIGIMWRNEKKPKRALEWFQKAVRLGDDEANLEIAKHYLHSERNPSKAIPYLQKVCQSNCVTEASAEEAAKLLRQARKQSNPKRKMPAKPQRIGSRVS